MDLTIEKQSDYVVATTSGPIDESAVDHFRETLHPLFSERGVKVILDLSGSPRVNSQGLAGLVTLVTDANTRGCRVIYASPAPFVAEVLRVTRLTTFFEVADTRQDAIEQLAQASA